MLQVCRDKQLQLSRQFQEKTLAHAIILEGIEGAGKDALGNWLIELLICQQPVVTVSDSSHIIGLNYACGQCKTCLLNKSKNYPDHLLLSSENKTLGVDDIRRGNAFLEKTAHIGQVKTILIPKAQNMTIAAANALLKTLEEPSALSFIVLLTDDIESVLPTVISRCAIYTIRPLVGEALITQLNVSNDDLIQLPHINKNNLSVNDHTFINFTHLPELTDVDIYQEFQVFNTLYINYLAHGSNESALLVQLIDNKHGLRWLEKVSCNLVRESYLTGNQSIVSQENLIENSALAKENKKGIVVSTTVLNYIYQAIINSNKLIKSYTQVNRQLVVEQLVMTISNIVRPPT
jgi:DNA polymerase-3 subunit delta'